MIARPPAARIALLGNAGGGKSTLARKIAAAHDLPYVEVDRLLWRPGWKPEPAAAYEAEHARAMARTRWVMDGLGQRQSIQARLDRATWIILVDMPLWVHYWLAAERQIAWSRGPIEHPPANAAAPPSTEALFRTIWEVDQAWMPEVRERIDRAQACGKRVDRIETFDQLHAYAEAEGLS